MSTNNGNSENKRHFAGALAATLGLVAIACGGDDDDDAPGGSSGSASGGSSSNGGKNASGGSSTAGKGSTPGGGRGGTAPTPGGGGEGGAPVLVPDDEDALNALLSAEYNAITAYDAGAGLINMASDEDPLYELRQVIVAVAVDIQSQHKLHAEALVDAIEAIGGTPVEQADIADAFVPPPALVANPTITNVLKFAASAERGAAVSYNQVIAGLGEAKHRFIATSIEGDETQHFIVLAALVLGLANPGPNLSVDTAGDVVPEAFVSKVGDVTGLEEAPADYFP
jgi:ferritin-like protein